MKDKELQKVSDQDTRPELQLVPAVDIYERKDEVVLIADLPGVGNKGLEVTVDNDQLTINGKATGHAGTDYVYERAFTLTDKIAKDKIAANLKDGVLTLSIPYAHEAKAKKVPITWN